MTNDELTTAPIETEPEQVMHPPTWPFDPEYCREYSAWQARYNLGLI